MTIKLRFPFFKFYPQDWIEATRQMTLEERGAYIDLIALTMQLEQALSDDDAWIAHALHVSSRKWRTLKARLVDHGKIRVEGGRIVNDRCLKELDALLGQRRNIAEAATNRERTKREPASNQRRTSDEKSKKPNKINATTTTTVDIAGAIAFAKDLDSDLERERNTPPALPQTQPVGVRVEDITGLNGATVVMVDTLAKWMSPIMPRQREAREWLGNTVQIFGSDVVKAAFADMQAKYAQDDIVLRPIPLMTSICQRRSEELKRKPKPSTQKPEGMPQIIWEQRQAKLAKGAAW